MAASLLAGCEAKSDNRKDDDDEEETKVVETEAVDEAGSSETTEETKIRESDAETAAETTAAVDYAYEEAYKSTIDSFRQTFEGDASGLVYNLIYVDGDATPELVIDMQGSFISLYTYADGNVYTLMDMYGYGAMGNAGYEYAPFLNRISNANSDYAGAQVWEVVMSINANHELENTWSGCYQYFAVGTDPFSEDFTYLDTPIYLLNDAEVSEEDYNSAKPATGPAYICGSYTYDEIMNYLNTQTVPESSRFAVVIKDMTWDEAEAYCENFGGHLATVSSDSEYTTICNMIDDYGDNLVLFVGGRASGDSYAWTTDGSNTPIDSHWRSGEPSHTGSTEDGRTVTEDRVCILNIDSGYYLMDVPNDMIDAAPSYSSHVGFVVEFG